MSLELNISWKGGLNETPPPPPKEKDFQAAIKYVCKSQVIKPNNNYYLIVN